MHLATSRQHDLPFAGQTRAPAHELMAPPGGESLIGPGGGDPASILSLFGGLFDASTQVAAPVQKGAKKSATPKEKAAIQARLDKARAAEQAMEAMREDLEVLTALKDHRRARDKERELLAKQREAHGAKREAMNLAVSAYGIDISNLKSFRYGHDIEDGSSEADGRHVTIGNDAFQDPGWLASSIAHEVEVHVNLQAMKGRAYDGNQGRAMNEVEAYDWEIRQAKRFGLSDKQVEGLRRNRQQYMQHLSKDNLARRARGDYSMPAGHEED